MTCDPVLICVHSRPSILNLRKNPAAAIRTVRRIEPMITGFARLPVAQVFEDLDGIAKNLHRPGKGWSGTAVAARLYLSFGLGSSSNWCISLLAVRPTERPKRTRQRRLARLRFARNAGCHSAASAAPHRRTTTAAHGGPTTAPHRRTAAAAHRSTTTAAHGGTTTTSTAGHGRTASTSFGATAGTSPGYTAASPTDQHDRPANKGSKGLIVRNSASEVGRD